MRWDQDPQVSSPVGQPIEALLTERPRRQDLPGFDPVYSDIVDYILRCTHRIWEQKNIGLCRTHYSDSCVMHTLNGPSSGLENVVQGTIGTLGIYTDRVVVGEDVIWGEDRPGVFLSSHRITSDGSQLGDEAIFGQATASSSSVTTIADCLCRGNLIIEEWLVRDNIRAVWQNGRDPWDVAGAQAALDQIGDQGRHAWRRDDIDGVREAYSEPPADHPAAIPASALRLALAEDLYGDAADLLSPAAEVRWPSGRNGWGGGFWIGCWLQLRAALQAPAYRLDHWAARPLPDGDIAVALRWRLTGKHLGHGVWGAPSGRELLILAVSHYRLRGGRIIEDITVFDELAVLRQIAGGLGA